MDAKTITQALAEEVRTNAELRRKIGMSEGAGSEMLETDSNDVNVLALTTDDEEDFFITVSGS